MYYIVYCDNCHFLPFILGVSLGNCWGILGQAIVNGRQTGANWQVEGMKVGIKFADETF